MEDIVCIICGGDKFSHYLNVKCRSTKELFTLNRCSCSLILTSPRPSESEMEKYYINYSPHSKANSKEYFFSKLFKIFSYFWKFNLLQKYMNANNIELLDVGGGDGSFALYLKNKIFKVSVYEKNQACIDFMNNNQIPASNKLSTFKRNSYNIITLWHSLEHIHKIDELFEQINRISRSNAYMIIATPNVSASEIKFLSDKWVAWDVPRHLYHFSYNTLNLLLDKHNWKIIKSKNMFQDTFFNIYMSLEGNFIKKIVLFLLIFPYSIIFQTLFNTQASSNLIICQKK